MHIPEEIMSVDTFWLNKFQKDRLKMLKLAIKYVPYSDDVFGQYQWYVTDANNLLQLVQLKREKLLGESIEAVDNIANW